MTPGTKLGQFLRVFLPTIPCLYFATYSICYGVSRKVAAVHARNKKNS